MVSILIIRLQVGRLLYKIVQTEIILVFPNYSLQSETLGAYKVFILRSTSLKLGLLNRKLYVDFKNPITNESVECRHLFSVFLDTLFPLADRMG